MKSKIKLTDREKSEDSLTESTLLKATQLFSTHGALWIENALDVDLITELQNAYQQRYTSLSRSKLAKKHAVVGNKRFMVTVDVESPFDSLDVFANPKLLPIIQRLLGRDCVISSFGSVVTFPGAAGQDIHFDFPPLYESEELCAALPPHAVTLVIPLVDIDEATGSTAIWEGSHNRVGSRQFLMELMHNPTWQGSVSPYPSIGDVYMMDYRVIHGGKPNLSDHSRPILYIVYARPWFRDAYNFADQPAIKIASEVRRSIPKEFRSLFPANS